MQEEIVKTDVLCIGGGIAGLMAAIRAREMGAKVVVAEKGNPLYSGCGRMGNDHFETWIPEVHGEDRDTWIEELLRTAKGEILISKDLLRAQFTKAYDIVKLWDSYGIPMKYKGKWEFAGHSFPGRPFTHIKYEGRFQKKVLVKQAKDRGAEIMGRVMVFDLLRQGDSIVGAIGVHTREDKVYVFQAKAVLLGTGKCSRLYPCLTPGWMFNDPHGGVQTGDGRAMAYRAGAELQNLEMPQRHIGPKYFAKFGQATWVGVMRGWDGKPAGTFVTKPDRKYGDMICEVNKLVPEQYTKSGKGPLYMDCRGIEEEDLEYMLHWFVHEGNVSLLDHMKEEGIDLRKHPIEFATYPLRGGGLIVANERAETTLKGLYAAGDEAFGDISAAATFGYIGGENAAKYVDGLSDPDLEVHRSFIEEKKAMIDQIRGREIGPDWEETNVALQQTMLDYAGHVRNESLLLQGLHHLRRIKEKAHASMLARNPHELGRCLEVLNMLDLGEITFIMALDRKETRGLHVRPDYPFTNPTLNQAHIICNRNGQNMLQWRPY
ncbi:MAG: FAD-binding protein [Deltaproteobacteria bacterium]|nr:FAD-binding protein [Deltaproteobacteria bacterium]MBW2304953.1 FAD-binding protein [Deltaproteobacteria bacterium]